jgi:hypothetical protein
MAENAGALVAIGNGRRRGTKDMTKPAYKHGLPVLTHLTDDVLETREPFQPILYAA